MPHKPLVIELLGEACDRGEVRVDPASPTAPLWLSLEGAGLVELAGDRERFLAATPTIQGFILHRAVTQPSAGSVA